MTLSVFPLDCVRPIFDSFENAAVDNQRRLPWRKSSTCWRLSKPRMTSAHWAARPFCSMRISSSRLRTRGQEAAEDVAADRFVALMKDGTGLHDALCRAEAVFNHPEHLVNAGDSFRVVIGVGAQHEKAVVAFFQGDLFLIDKKVAASFNLN